LVNIIANVKLQREPIEAGAPYERRVWENRQFLGNKSMPYLRKGQDRTMVTITD